MEDNKSIFENKNQLSHNGLQQYLLKQEKSEDATKWTPLPCSNHKMDNEKMGYIQWHEHADKLIAEGKEQTRCPNCGRYLFPHEF